MEEEDLRGEYGLFVRYCDAIKSNPDLGIYEKYMYHLFPYVADYMDEENEDFFFERVSTLAFEDCKGQDYAGCFDFGRNTVVIDYDLLYGEAYFATTVYHELMHFLDFSMNGPTETVYYMQDGSFLSEDECREDQYDQIVISLGNGYFIEGGAELYFSELIGSSPCTYWPAEQFLVGLEYIFGSERIAEMFFSEKTDELFVDLLLENGFSSEEIVKLYNAMPYMTAEEELDPETVIDPKDVLIRLYINNIGPDYESDAAFSRIVCDAELIEYPDFPSEFSEYTDSLSTFSEKQQKNMISYFKENGMETDGMLVIFYAPPTPYYWNGELKLVSLLWFYGDVDNVFKTVVIDYDFEAEEILGFEIIEGEEWIPQEIDDQMELVDASEVEALRAELTFDNSAAHEQVVTGNDPYLTEEYARAVEIGNRYGIYIWFADLIPKGVLLADDTAACDPDAIRKALDSVEKVLALYPEDYFDQLCFEYYSGVVLVMYDGWYEDAYGDSIFVDGKKYLSIYVNVSLPQVQGYPGVNTVMDEYFNPVYYAVDPLEAEMLIDIGSVTERVVRNINAHFSEPIADEETWMACNYDGFSYSNLVYYEEDSLTEKAAKSQMEYFLVPESLMSGRSDRLLLYEYMMCRMLLTDKRRERVLEIPEECRAKVEELCRGIRATLGTDAWPEETSWETSLG